MYKLGRQKRVFNAKIPHMSAILASRKFPMPPASVDWTKGVTEYSTMLNTELGCCTISAIFHSIQIWSLNSSEEITESDKSVLSLYEEACGYSPDDSSSDQGGIEQNVLKYCCNTGVPLDDGTREKFLGFAEVDTRNINDIKTTIAEFGICYLGVEIPQGIWDESGNPKTVWDGSGDSEIVGGHAIAACKYDETGVTVISWGSLYLLTWEFFSKYVDEAYAIISQDWINSQNKTPLGLTKEELENLMNTVKED